MNGTTLRSRVALAAVLGAACLAAAVLPAGGSAIPFAWVEATIAEVQARFADGTLDCEGLVGGYLGRIEAYDRSGPALQSVISVDPRAEEAARALDDAYDATGPVGPLHCVPILLKDNIDTASLPTTAGSKALESSRPPDDAHIVARLREAGALVLGKANMDEFAFGFEGSSSLGGEVRNPYDPARGAGGSSSGTGAAVAASLALAGLGTDTGGSIRVPSSVHGLVGIRPSLRLVSQDGVIPLARFQDTAGPMCRSVTDCALLLSEIAGFDPGTSSGQNTLPLQRDDEATPISSAQEFELITGLAPGEGYVGALDPAGLEGARIGVVRALFGSDPDVVAAVDGALEVMRAAGAVVEDVEIDDLAAITGYASVSRWEFRDHLTGYLQSWPSAADGHKRSFEEVAISLQYESSRVPTFLTYGLSGIVRYQDPDYERNTRERSVFVRPRIQATLDNAGGEPYDVLLYPSVLSPPAVGGPPATGSNNRLSAFSGFPALTMPAGFTPTTTDRVALPIGMELLAREFDEATLLRIAYAYEVAVAGTDRARRPPTFTPELP